MELSPVLQLQIGPANAGAAAAGGGGGGGGGSSTTPKSVSQQRRSITSLLFLPGQEYTLLTGGDMDGAVRFWDLRSLRKPTSCLVAPAAGGCQAFSGQNGNSRAGGGSAEGAAWPVVGSWEGGNGGSGSRRSPGSALKQHQQQHQDCMLGGGGHCGAAGGFTLYHQQQKGVAAGSGRRGARGKGAGVGEAAASCWMSLVCPATRPQGITSLSLSPLGDLLLVSTSDAAHYVYPLTGLSAAPVHTLSGHTANTYCVKSGFSPDGRQVISGSSNHLVHVWNVSGVREGHLRDGGLRYLAVW
jgi:WD40 repeat protein